jgi:hypothetical protein
MQLFRIEWCKRMITLDKIESIVEEAVVAYFKVLSRYSPTGTEKNHEEPH